MNNELKAKELVSLYTYTIFKDKNHDFYWCKCEESGLMQLGGDMESALLSVTSMMEIGIRNVLNGFGDTNCAGSYFKFIPPTRLQIKKSAKEKKVNDVIFLGSGTHCLPQIRTLHEKLDGAIESLGGEQQNGGMGSEYDPKSAIEHKELCINVITDMIAALGLKDNFELSIKE